MDENSAIAKSRIRTAVRFAACNEPECGHTTIMLKKESGETLVKLAGENFREVELPAHYTDWLPAE